MALLQPVVGAPASKIGNGSELGLRYLQERSGCQKVVITSGKIRAGVQRGGDVKACSEGSGQRVWAGGAGVFWLLNLQRFNWCRSEWVGRGEG